MDVQEIRTLTVKALSDGFPQVLDDINKMSAAQGGLAVVSDSTTRAQTTVAKAYETAQRSLDLNYASSVKFNQIQLAITTAYNQGLVSLDRYNQLSALNAQKFDQTSLSSKAFGAALTGVSGQLIALSAGAGPVGVFLSALGPWGIGAAVALGGLEKAFSVVSDAAHALAQRSEEIRIFSEVTGLTTDQVQALGSEAGKFGLSAEQAQTSIQHFTAQFEQLRLGTGTLLTQIRQVSPALADQMQTTTNAADALTLFGQVLNNVDDVFQRNALIKAATGRGGLAGAQFFSGLNVDAVTASFVNAGKALDENLIQKLAQLEIDIKKTSAASSQALASIFSEQALEAELRYQESWLAFALSVKNFSLSGDLRYLLEAAAQGVHIGGPGTLLGSLGVDYKPSYVAAAEVPQRVTGPEVLAPLTGSPIASTAADTLPQPTPDPQKTLQAQIADLKTLQGVLGPAFTLQQQYNLALTELEQKAKTAGVAEGSLTYTLAENALGLDNAIKLQNAHNSALGASATVQDQVNAKLDELQKKQNSLKGSGKELTDSQYTNAQRLIQVQADGTFALQANIDATKVQTETIGTSIGYADAYSLIQTKVNENLNAGKPLLDGVSASFVKLAVAAGAAKQAQAELKAQNDATFGLQTALLSSIDAQIASIQRGLHSNDWQSYMNDGLSAVLRITDQLKSAKQRPPATAANSNEKGVADEQRPRSAAA